MPNHCFNRVEFYSDVEEDIKKLHDIFSIDLESVDEERTIFGQFIPEPHWPTTPLTEESAKGIVYDRGEVGELPVSTKETYGTINKFTSTGNTDDRWYDWRLRYWDTKWDCYDLEIDEDDLPNGFEVQFNTAWSPPEGICRAMRKQYPDIDISWFYDEPGEAIAGYL